MMRMVPASGPCHRPLGLALVCAWVGLLAWTTAGAQWDAQPYRDESAAGSGRKSINPWQLPAAGSPGFGAEPEYRPWGEVPPEMRDDGPPPGERARPRQQGPDHGSPWPPHERPRSWEETRRPGGGTAPPAWGYPYEPYGGWPQPYPYGVSPWIPPAPSPWPW